MLKSKTFITTTIIFSLFLIGFLIIGLINGSDAVLEDPGLDGEPVIQIEEVTVDGYAYMDNDIYLSVSVKTNEPFDEVNYYFDGTWIGASSGDGTKTEATFSSYPDGGEGSVTGVTYQIRVDVWRQHDNGFFTQDSSSNNLTIYTPIYTNTADGGQDIDFVSGYAAINKHTYDPVSGYMSFDYSVSASHNGDGPSINLSTEHKASFFALNIEDRKMPANGGSISEEPGDRYWSDPDSSHGTTIFGGNADQKYTGEAYVRIIADTGHQSDDYHLTNTMDCLHP